MPLILIPARLLACFPNAINSLSGICCSRSCNFRSVLSVEFKTDHRRASGGALAARVGKLSIAQTWAASDRGVKGSKRPEVLKVTTFIHPCAFRLSTPKKKAAQQSARRLCRRPSMNCFCAVDTVHSMQSNNVPRSAVYALPMLTSAGSRRSR